METVQAGGSVLPGTGVLRSVISILLPLFLSAGLSATTSSVPVEGNDGGGACSFDSSFPATEPVRRKTPPLAAAGHDDIIDVLVVYTSFARGRHGGTEGIQALIEDAVQLTNTAFINSGIPARLRVVHMEEVGYGESPQPSFDDLDWVHRDGAVAAARRNHNADLVVLVTDRGASQGTGGIAAGLLKNTLGAFHAQFSASVVAASEAVARLAFAHEVGHNLAAHHALDDQPPAENLLAVRHAHGWAIPEKEMMTVMAQKCSTCRILPYFSNPSVLFEGVPTGMAGVADNSRAIRFAAPVVANYRNIIGPSGMLELEHDPVVAERAGRAVVRVLREKGSRGPISVEYRTVELEGEAQPGVDFSPATGTLSWPDGDARPREITIEVPRGGSGEKLLGIQLFNATGGAVLFRGGLAILTVVDTGPPGAGGQIEFESDSQIIREGENLLVTIRRRGGSAGAIGVNFSTIEGSADRTDDFGQLLTVVTWGTGDASIRTLSIPIHRDEIDEDDETFLLRLQGEPGLLGRQRSMAVTILDSPQPRRRAVRR